jgi:hypothetical protein
LAGERRDGVPPQDVLAERMDFLTRRDDLSRRRER